MSAATRMGRPAVWAIVPAKSLRDGKSRLAAVLSPGDRESLNRSFLRRTLEVVGAVPAIASVLVVSADAAALAVATDRGAIPLAEPADLGLNRALELAREHALAGGAGAIVTVSADLPWLTTADLDAVLAAGEGAAGVTIAPDEPRQGTNVLYQRPGDLLAFRYGGSSFAKHREQARRRGVEARSLERAGLAFDVDSPSDLARYQATFSSPREARAASRASSVR